MFLLASGAAELSASAWARPVPWFGSLLRSARGEASAWMRTSAALLLIPIRVVSVSFCARCRLCDV